MTLQGFSPPTPGCACEICRVLRSHSAPLEFELSDTLPAKTDRPMTLEQIRDELRKGWRE